MIYRMCLEVACLLPREQNGRWFGVRSICSADLVIGVNLGAEIRAGNSACFSGLTSFPWIVLAISFSGKCIVKV